MRFREHPEFYEAYFHIYGEAFAEKVDTAKGSVEAHAKSAKSGSSAEQEGSIIDGVAHKVSKTTRSKKHPLPIPKNKKCQIIKSS